MLHLNLEGTRTSELIDQVTGLTTLLAQRLHDFEIIDIHRRLNQILVEIDSRPRDKAAALIMRCRIKMCLIRRAYLQTN